MKKSIIVMLLVFFISALLALESEPSETVGYVRVDAIVGYTSFSLPFTFYDDTYTETLDLDDIIADQLTGGNLFNGDQIIEIGGNFAYYNSTTNQWTGDLEDFTDNKAYYFKIQTGHPEKNVYLAGTVKQESQSMFCDVGYTVVGIREAGIISVEDLDLLTSGFTGGNIFSSDQLIELGGDFAWYNTGTSSWDGSLTHIEPGKVYYIKVQSAHSAFTWNYNPLTRITNSQDFNKIDLLGGKK